MIKVVNLVSLLAAPLIVSYEALSARPDGGSLRTTVVIIMLVITAIIFAAVFRSKAGKSTIDLAGAPQGAGD